MHSMPMFQFSCARQNIKRFGGIMKHVQMLQLVACFLLLNFAQMADEMMLIMSLVLRHQFPRHQATLFMVEHRRTVAFTTNDKQVYHIFVYLVAFNKLLPGTNFVGGAFEKMSASAKKIVKSRQTVRTCKVLVMTENLFK